MTISGGTVVVGMTNGMIGGVILVLPLLALEGGSLTTFIVIVVSGIFSYYSCRLCVKHLGPCSDLDEAVLNHFNHSIIMKVFYDIVVFLNLAFLLMLYFDLIVEQWAGMVPDTILNPIINCVILFILVFVMKYFDFGASLLAYGIVSVIGYVIFLVLLVDEAPAGENQIPLVGDGVVDMAASMGQAFAIQTFFIPILRKNPQQENYQLYIFLSYLVGTLVYLFIGYAGSYGIVNIKPQKQHPQTIEDYFQRGYWEVYSLEIIYLIHLYSVFPEFLLISKKRLFNAVGLEGAKKGEIPWKEAIFSILLIGLCLGISLSGIQIDDIIEVNGAVIGFFFIYFLPLIMHIKCIYLNNKPPLKQPPSTIEIQPISPSSIAESPAKESLLPKSSDNMPEEEVPYCYASKASLTETIFDAFMLLGMLGVGTFIMIDGLISVFS